MNPYQEARERLELANQAHRELRIARAVLERTETVVEAEWAAATRNLRRYESKPGIPLPQYRTWSTREDTGTIQFTEATQ